MKQAFIKFLNEKGLLDWFRIEVQYNLPHRDADDFLERCTRHHPELIILKAFDWRYSNFGFHFWSDINKEWQEYVKLHS